MGQFLSRYGAYLLGCGATCIRLETNLNRMAAVWGKKIEITIMPRHLHITVLPLDNDEDEDTYTNVVTVRNIPVDFNMNTCLSRLSWEVADGRIGFSMARHRLNEIVSRRTGNDWVTLLLVSIANASFCRLFGGDITAMAIVATATAVGYFLKLTLLKYKVDTRLVFILCAFVSTVIGSTDYLFSFGATPALSLGASVLYLVPGIPFLNSFSDMLYRHYICAFSRFMDAMILTGCLSLGLCAGMLLMNVGMF